MRRLDPHDPLAWRDAIAQAECVRRGELSRRELVAAAIERIEASNRLLNAVVVERFQAALDEAESASGPFAGVPLLLKDLSLEVAGVPYHAGTALLKRLGWRSPSDSHLAARYRKAGFVFLGRTNSSELGLMTSTEPWANGPTRNPWNPARSPGGSSGGSAAAVAAGLVPLAHASDAVGSIRIPAAACGLVGLKPSRGRVPLGPQPIHDVAGLVSQHVLTRSVRDAAAVLDATAGPIPGERYTAAPPARRYAEELDAATAPSRIGCLTQPLDPRVPFDRGCGEVAREAAGVLESLGHRVEPAWPEALSDGRVLAQLGTLSRVAVAAWLDHFAGATGSRIEPGDVEPFTLESAALGRAVTGLEYAAALDALDAHARRLVAWWRSGYDLLVTPTLPIEPWRLGALAAPPDRPLAAGRKVAETVTFTAHFNVSGQPAISLPIGQTQAGLPVGVQLVAAPGREDLLIRLAAQLERERPWAGRRPGPAPAAATS